MNQYLISLIQKYRRKGILVDTNLLLLYLVGIYDIEQIRDFKRTSQFNTDDFTNTQEFIDLFEVKITTPHILTEVCDFMGNRDEFLAMLQIYDNIAQEKFISSKEVCEDVGFISFGLADISTLLTAKDSYLVFTDDKPLLGYLLNLGIDAGSLDQVRIVE